MELTDLEVTRLIGKGKYAFVYEVRFRNAQKQRPRDCAMKRVFFTRESALDFAKREFSIMVTLSQCHNMSPFISRLFGVQIIHNSVAFFITKGCGYDLHDVVDFCGYMEEDEARFYACEVIAGLNFLHAQGIVHLDIKAANVLIDDDGHVIISDFDCAFDLNSGDPDDGNFLGTFTSMAPEVAKCEIISTKSDIWSLGALIAKMVSGSIRKRMESKSMESELAKKNVYFIKREEYLSEPLRSLLKACLHTDPEDRPSTDELKRYQFFSDINWDSVEKRGYTPPVHPSEIRFCPVWRYHHIRSRDAQLLKAALEPGMPVVVEKGLKYQRDSNGVKKLLTSKSDEAFLRKMGISVRKLRDIFRFSIDKSHA